MTLREEFCDRVKREVENQSVYVWGGQGQFMELLTVRDLERMETSKRNVERILNHVAKIYDTEKGLKDVRVFDCSGLVTYHLIAMKVLKSDTSANGLYKLCKPVTKKDLKPGDLAFKISDGKAVHVAVYIGNGKLVESVGRDDGVKETDLTSKFTKFGIVPAFVPIP